MKIGDAIVTVLLAIVGVAIVAVLVSNHANTGSVLGAGGSAIANALACAESPVTGGSCGSGSGITPLKIPSVSSNISYDMNEYQN